MDDSPEPMDIRAYNRKAWDHNVGQGNPWTVPVDSATVQSAREGTLALLLTPQKPVPSSWYPRLKDADVLCLASGGGQQAPLLAAAGASVVVLDNSPRQLQQDRLVADREGLAVETLEGDAANLAELSNERFDMVFHPCSNCFMADIRSVWAECFRVLRPGGRLLSGFCNPVRYIFDDEKMDEGTLEVRHSIPYSDLADLPAHDRQRRILDQQRPLEFGHSLEDQIAGQLEAGFVLRGFYEDKYREANDPLSRYLDTFIATHAAKHAGRSPVG